MKKTLFIPLLAAVTMIMTSCGNSAKESFKTDYFELGLSPSGNIVTLKDRASGVNYAPQEAVSPLLQLHDGENFYAPTGMDYADSALTLTFANGSVATITVRPNKEYIKLKLTDLTNRESISSVIWGPYVTSITKYIGETVCVVRDDNYSVGMQALNINTVEGLPRYNGDAYGGSFVDPLPGQEVPDEYKDKIGQEVPFVNVNVEGDMPECIRLWRGAAAFTHPLGSEMRLFSKDLTKGDTLYNYGGRTQYVEPVDVDYIGSSVAIFGCPEPQTLDVIEQIELSEGLPHPMIEGVWLKRWEKQDRAYMLYEGGSMDNALNYADSCDFELIHIGDFFRSWGNFGLETPRFPRGAEDIKALNDKARARGKRLGVHTLTMFTSQHDPYVSPVPSDSLAKTGSSVLSKDISDKDTEIFIEDTTFFVYTGPTRTAKIGKELISYRSVSKDRPFRLLDCNRGQFGSKVSAHKAGETIDKLINDDYSGFFPDIKLQEAYSLRLSDVVNQTTIGLMDFDGFGGGSPTGHGCYGAGKFVEDWYNNLEQYPITCGAGTFHYYWHVYTYMNWGEPWYDDLRNSQVNYRLENQRYFKRNLMPGMLGWFKLEATYRPEDIEWIQARSAGFDAGYLLRVDEGIEANGFKSQLFSAIREWQKARNSGAFTPRQIELMQNPKNEFHLERVADGEWQLYQVALKKGNEHKFRAVQTGEPLLSKFTFDNPYDEQPVQFFVYVKSGEDKSGTIRNLTLDIEGYESVGVDGTVVAGDKIYCDGRSLYVCDSFWKPRTVTPLTKAPKWVKGENKVIARGEFSSEKAPLFEVEFKALGNAETVTAK